MTSPLGGGFGGNLRDRSPWRELDAGTGGVRDTYQPNTGSIASQAQYTAEIEKAAWEGRKGPLARFLRAIRRSIWGS
jgi:hypothetical protein